MTQLVMSRSELSAQRLSSQMAGDQLVVSALCSYLLHAGPIL